MNWCKKLAEAPMMVRIHRPTINSVTPPMAVTGSSSTSQWGTCHQLSVALCDIAMDRSVSVASGCRICSKSGPSASKPTPRPPADTIASTREVTNSRRRAAMRRIWTLKAFTRLPTRPAGQGHSRMWAKIWSLHLDRRFAPLHATVQARRQPSPCDGPPWWAT